MEGLEKLSLAQRTRLRNAALWITVDWGGILSPLGDQQTACNLLSRAAIENSMAISDEAYEIKESQRNRTVELDQDTVNQNLQIAKAKVATGRAKLAIQMATDEYTLAAMVYDAKTKALIMGVREYAAQVEIEQLAVEENRAVLAISKEGLRIDQINAQVYYETINKAQVEADLARAQVDVAKAHVRAIMADIGAREADVKAIEAKVQEFMATADKATLQADVAGIFAQIMVKQLSTVKLDVGRAEIQAGFRYIQNRLTDMLTIWDTKTLIQNLKTELENALAQEIDLTLAAGKGQEDLRETETLNAREVLDYTKTQTEANIQDEISLRQDQVKARTSLADARLSHAMQRDAKQTWADALINLAHKYTYLHSSHAIDEKVTTQEQAIDMTKVNEYISS